MLAYYTCGGEKEKNDYVKVFCAGENVSYIMC